MLVNSTDSLPFLDCFSPDENAVLQTLFQVVDLPAESVLFEQGYPADLFFIVVAGEVLIRYKPEDGPALILTRVRPNGVVGWSAAIGSPTYTSSAISAAETRLLCVRSEDLRRLYETHPPLAQRLLERLALVIAERLRQTHPQIMALLEYGMRLSTGAELL